MKKIIHWVLIITILLCVTTSKNNLVSATKAIEQVYSYDNYKITYDIVDIWDNYQNINITITNISNESITGWALQYDAGGEISNLWNGVIYESNGSKYIIKNSGYNFEIEQNTSITFGYTLSGTNLSIPSEIKLCSNREEKTFGYEVNFIVSNDWETGFEGEIKISNKTDEPIEAWTVIFNSNFIIDNLWNAKVISHDNTTYELASQQWTTPVEPNSTMILGITASKEKGIIPKLESIRLTEVVINNKFINDNSDVIIDDEDDGIYYKDISNKNDIIYENSSIGYVKNQMLVMVDDSVPFSDISNWVKTINAEIVGYIDITNEYQIELNYDINSEQLNTLIDELHNRYSFIENISLNYVFTTQNSSQQKLFPNDPYIELDAGVNASNWNLYAINVFRAWEFYEQMTTVNIGVIDEIFLITLIYLIRKYGMTFKNQN